MTTSPRTGFTELEESETIPQPVVVEQGRRIEQGANLYIVEDKDENDPPATCTDGDAWIVAATATGDWTGHEGEIAFAVGTNAANGWLFRDPIEGLFAYVQDENKLYRYDGSAWGEWAQGGNPTESLVVAASDETTAITAVTGKVTFRMPYAFTLSAVRASLTGAAATGTFTVDINEGGTTILSTKLTIDATEKTSTTAATAAVISDTALADDAEITIDVDDDADGTATGLKVYLIGTRA